MNRPAPDLAFDGALDGVLALLVRSAPATAASLWVPTSDGVARLAGSDAGGADAVALQLLQEPAAPPPISVGGHAGIRVDWDGRAAALVLAAEPGGEQECLQALTEVAQAVTALSGWSRSHPGAGQREPGLAEANERLLVRLGFDLHDGPLQQVYVLAQDVRLLREQMVMLVASEHGEPVVGRFADLESQLAELHQDLRDLAHSLEPRSLLQQPLPDAVARELTALNRRTGIATSIELEGSFDALSASQRIALLRVLQEALSNIRQHSGSRAVAVTLLDEPSGICMEIRDDGHGFDPAAVTPAEDGQSGIGLVGMRERLGLLAGRLEIESAPGGPTVLRARLPHWLPPGA
jgi:signal transduction histidine kinase